MKTLLQFSSVTKRYKNKTIIDNFSISLKEGEVVVIVGPSGCGKTTILNLAAGLIKQTEGEINRYTQDVGYVFQEPRLIPWKTILENLLFVMDRRDELAKVKALNILDKVGLKEKSDYYPRQLSGGMKQRVSIARAFLYEPEIILMDEPFSALDIQLKRELQNDFIHLIKDRSTSVLYVTHDLHEAATVGDRILLFSESGTEALKEMDLPNSRGNRSPELISELQTKIEKALFGGCTNE